MRSNAKRGRLIACIATAIVTLSANQALALQPHEGLEGMITHEVGHLFFIVGVVYLLVRSRSRRWIGPGWKEFKLFLWFVLAWNAVAFAGHWIELYIPPEQFIKSGGNTTDFVVTGFADILYYVSVLDHLVLLPASIFLLLALRRWRSPEGAST